MISDERLEPDYDLLGKDALMAIFRRAESSMVQELALRLIRTEKELLALRVAFSEPVCCIEPPELSYLANGNDARVYWPEAAEHGDILLYRKPPTD
ncbi:MAG: hypothetical protein PW844_18995 [Pantoea sp.]|uniref:hypothetical protein n=1 Tax=Pantoea sp. TaxID=69393 RepID=UPI0023992A8F|nr:hypothetical protein [Pantoea sp.]MDE1188536.1 hypothetical protein [Pantoea sp.]